MGTKLFYWFLIMTPVCMGVQNDLFARDNINLLDKYIFTPAQYNCMYPKQNSSFFNSSWPFDNWSRKKKVVALNLAAVGTILAVGSASWDYCSSSFHFENEGWFDPDTNYGGADKLGHAFSAYSLTSLYSNIYKKFGYSDEQAILGGALSGWSQMTLIEICDGFSEEQGFCWEDEAMNTIGAGMAYLRHRFPAIKEKVDFRMEWYPSPAFRHGDRSDPFTDYSGQKYLLALKPDGFLDTGDPLLKLMELQFGYYSRGYATGDNRYFDSKNRYGYIGIGLNITYLLEKLTGYKAGGIFNYFQIPCTYISLSTKIN